MMQIVSEEDSRRWREEVKHLRQSASLEDRIVAIMMDLEIGGSGNGGDPARAKARTAEIGDTLRHVYDRAAAARTTPLAAAMALAEANLKR